MSKKNHILNLVAFSLFIVTAAWVAYHLIALVIFQRITITEMHRWISIPETVFALAVLGLAIERYISYIRRNDGGGNKDSSG